MALLIVCCACAVAQRFDNLPLQVQVTRQSLSTLVLEITVGELLGVFCEGNQRCVSFNSTTCCVVASGVCKLRDQVSPLLYLYSSQYPSLNRAFLLRGGSKVVFSLSLTDDKDAFRLNEVYRVGLIIHSLVSGAIMQRDTLSVVFPPVPTHVRHLVDENGLVTVSWAAALPSTSSVVLVPVNVFRVESMRGTSFTCIASGHETNCTYSVPFTGGGHRFIVTPVTLLGEGVSSEPSDAIVESATVPQVKRAGNSLIV